MKILIVSDTYYPDVNGASYFTQRIAYYLKQKGNDILVVKPSHSFSNKTVSYNGVNVYEVWALPTFINELYFCAPLLIVPTIKKIFDTFTPDVVHTQGHFFLSKAVCDEARKRNIAILGTNHFMPENITHYIPLPRPIVRKIEQLAWYHFKRNFNYVEVVTTPTKRAAELLRKIGFNKEVIPVSCGLDLSVFKKMPRSEELRKRYGIPNKPILLYAGRLDREKNVDQILRALPNVLKKVDLHFVIIGKGMEKQNWERLTTELGLQSHVTFTGFVPDEDLPAMYNFGDCYIIACQVELQCITCMEAMSSGLPVIAVNAMALPELVHDGQNGYLFEGGNTVQITNFVITIFNDAALRERMGKMSLEIIKKHDINNTIQQFGSLYKQAIRIKASETAQEPVPVKAL